MLQHRGPYHGYSIYKISLDFRALDFEQTFMFTSIEVRLLWDTTDLLTRASSYNDIVQTLNGPLRSLMPCQFAASGIGQVSTHVAIKVLNIGFPACLAGMLARETCPLHALPMDIWREGGKTTCLLLDMTSTKTDTHQPWGDICHSYGIQQVVAYGFRDPIHDLGTFVIFARNAPRLTERDNALLQIVGPLIHDSFLRAIDRSQSQLAIQVADEGGGTDISPREIEVLRWVRAGKTNFEISMILGISEHTVKNHMKKIMFKLNASNRAHAIVNATSLGLFPARNQRLEAKV